MNPILFLFGGRRITVQKSDALWALNICYRFSISAHRLKRTADGGLLFDCKRKDAKFLQARAMEKNGNRLEEVSIGLPCRLLRYRKRYGLMAGGVFGAFLLLFSSRFVWDVKIRGNETVTETELQNLFAECGLAPGAKISEIDVPALENRILLKTDRLSWVSVTVDGTVADVQVIETVEAPPKETLQPANLIASADGEITLFELYRGMPTVKIGETVHAGDLLVSGITESPTKGVLFTRASGAVLAKTEREITVEVPLVQTEKVEIDRKMVGLSLTFFGKTLNFFKSCGNQADGCDIIKRNIIRFSDLSNRVPIRLDAEWEIRYAETEKTLSPAEAEASAFLQLQERLDQLSDGAELLEKTVTAETAETAFRLICKINCIENIAKQSEFEIS